MKLSYIAERPGDSYTPLVRLYEFTLAEVRELHRLFMALALGETHSVVLHEQPFIQPIDDCRLVLVYDFTRDVGVKWNQTSHQFECVYSEDGWLEVAGKTEPFLENIDPNSCADLTNEGDFLFLLSPDGGW